jgi:hypothetical protein
VSASAGSGRSAPRRVGIPRAPGGAARVLEGRVARTRLGRRVAEAIARGARCARYFLGAACAATSSGSGSARPRGGLCARVRDACARPCVELCAPAWPGVWRPGVQVWVRVCDGGGGQVHRFSGVSVCACVHTRACVRTPARRWAHAFACTPSLGACRYLCLSPYVFCVLCIHRIRVCTPGKEDLRGGGRHTEDETHPQTSPLPTGGGDMGEAARVSHPSSKGLWYVCPELG